MKKYHSTLHVNLHVIPRTIVKYIRFLAKVVEFWPKWLNFGQIWSHVAFAPLALPKSLKIELERTHFKVNFQRQAFSCKTLFTSSAEISPKHFIGCSKYVCHSRSLFCLFSIISQSHNKYGVTSTTYKSEKAEIEIVLGIRTQGSKMDWRRPIH